LYPKGHGLASIALLAGIIEVRPVPRP